MIEHKDEKGGKAIFRKFSHRSLHLKNYLELVQRLIRPKSSFFKDFKFQEGKLGIEVRLIR